MRKKKINEIAQKIKYKEMNRDSEQTLRKELNGPLPLTFRIMPPSMRQFLCDMGFKYISSMDKAFEINHSCNGCGICSKVCPVKNIMLNNSGPIWNHQCEQCFACLQWCPHQAIEYGQKTISRKRYHHYDVTLQDMMKQAG